MSRVPTDSQGLLTITATATGAPSSSSKDTPPTVLPYTARAARYRRRNASSFTNIKRENHHELPQTHTLNNVIQTTLVPSTRSLSNIVQTPQTLSHGLSPASQAATAPVLSPRGPLVARSFPIYGYIVLPFVPVIIIVGIIGWFVYKKKLNK
ncbi:hypothetical protein TWF173_000783 [Orbilia oligospora]|nr:hypothetical protein TWF173_000783 [Orbilia oligospora]